MKIQVHIPETRVPEVNIVMTKDENLSNSEVSTVQKPKGEVHETQIHIGTPPTPDTAEALQELEHFISNTQTRKALEHIVAAVFLAGRKYQNDRQIDLLKRFDLL